MAILNTETPSTRDCNPLRTGANSLHRGMGQRPAVASPHAPNRGRPVQRRSSPARERPTAPVRLRGQPGWGSFAGPPRRCVWPRCAGHPVSHRAARSASVRTPRPVARHPGRTPCPHGPRTLRREESRERLRFRDHRVGLGDRAAPPDRPAGGCRALRWHGHQHSSFSWDVNQFPR